MYKDVVVKKPWGYEYLVYENSEIALWFLCIEKDQQTSMHCHPQKTTGLVVLDGEVEVSFLADVRKLSSMEKVMIRRGLFHSTKSLADKSLIFEIETPNNKHDLVRLNDVYGRSKLKYEGETFERQRNDMELWIDDAHLNLPKEYTFANCILRVEIISDIGSILKKKDTDIIMFLKGGMMRVMEDKTYSVTVPGDVGYGYVVKEVAKQLDGVLDGTTIMTIVKNNEYK